MNKRTRKIVLNALAELYYEDGKSSLLATEKRTIHAAALIIHDKVKGK